MNKSSATSVRTAGAVPVAGRQSAMRLLMGGALVLALTALWLPTVQAADAPHAGAALQPGRSYVVMPGDTLDKVVQKTMASSPLKNEVLREALVASNAQVLPSGRNPRLVPGTVLQLPDPDTVLRTVLGPAAPPHDAAPAGGAGEQRRRWVRYP